MALIEKIMFKNTLLIASLLMSFLTGLAQESIPPDTTAGQKQTLIKLREIEVFGQAEKNIYPVSEVNESQIEKVPSRDVGDLLRSASNVSGIRKGGIGIDPVIRGFKYSQLNIQINEGQKVESACPNRMDPPVSHIDVNDIHTVEIHKGPYALRFGPNFGGIIHVHTFPTFRPQSFKLNVSYQAGFESAWKGMKQHLSLLGGSKYYQFQVSGNYKNYGDFQDGDGNMVKSSFEKYNLNTLLRITPFDKFSFTFSYDWSFGRNIMFAALPMDERTDDTHLSSFDLEGQDIGNTLETLYIKLYNSDVRHVMDNKQRPFSDTVVAVSDIRAVNSGYRVEAGLNVSGGLLRVGTDFENIRKEGTRKKYFIQQPTLPVKTEKLWDNAIITNMGLFAEYTYTFSRFSVVGSLRYDLNAADSSPLTWENMQGQPIYSDDNTSSNHSNVSASLGSRIRAGKDLTVILSAGRGVRSPDMSERFIVLLPIGYDNYDYLGNPSLKPEVNYQADLGLEWVSPLECLFTLNLFYSNVNDFILGELVPESEVKPQTKGVYGVKKFTNISKAWLTGFEFGYTSSPRFNWQLEARMAYTLGVNPIATRYIIENNQVIGSEEVRNDPLPEIPPLEGTVNFSYHLFHGRLVPKVTIRAVAAQNRISSAYGEKKSPGFILPGLSLYYDHKGLLQVSAGVDNLFDKNYFEHLNRNIIGSGLNLYEPGINFFINLMFKI